MAANLESLQRHYATLEAAYNDASAHEDDSGEEIPRELWLAYHQARRDLHEEESRITNLATHNPPTP